ncbi:flagellar biosynthetic protein FliO [Aminipila sp.]|uniref:flagellar biosynthetic protein FliO n=1 Tax=Aminipila sp. TaxID=2060095 RepID=UPI001D8FB412|nr:flagellar biosynthetic protein FliO [Aminipila sp.]MBE6033275.1 flagellar biosynthetic protein FliO [Clostridiales bacterium]
MVRILSTIIPLLLALLAVVAVIYLSYIFSKYVALGASKMSGTRYMRVVDRMALGQDKMMIIVQIGDKYFLAGVTSQNVQILKELSGEDLIEMEEPIQPTPLQQAASFKSALQKYMNKKDD